MLPQSTIYANEDDIRYILFEQSEVISDEIRTKGYWNLTGMQLASKILLSSSKLYQGGTIIDIGSGFGSFSIPLAVKFANYFRFECFEPIPFLVNQLSTNILLNCLSNVNVYKVGISNIDETITYPTIDPTSCGNYGSFSFSDEYNNIRNIKNTEYELLYELKKIDSYNYQDAILIKISCNGLEKEVLDGAVETISACNHPPIIIELWNDDFFKEKRLEIIDYIKDLGYSHFHIENSCVFCFSSQDMYDVLMTEFNDDGEEVSSSNSDSDVYEIVEEVHDTKTALETQGIYDQSKVTKL